MKFGAFIVTYNRPQTLIASIGVLGRQTVKPEHILIIDNSEQQTAREPVSGLGVSTITYVAMGHNAGPAGAARFGMQWFKDRGYDWAYWGDDDNPPERDDVFERIFGMIATESKIGVGVAVGQKFNFSNGKVVRLADEELHGHIDVDVISGPSTMVINLQAINESTLPDARLFFGFEEFEFALKIKKAGYRIVVDGDLMRELRIKYSRINLPASRQKIRSRESMWREYYSIRNMIFLFHKVYPEHRQIVVYRIFAALGKMIIGFKYGLSEGMRNARYQCLAIIHGLTGKLGFRISSK